MADDRIHNIFMDPTGVHLIISFQSGENYYWVQGALKPKQLKKLTVCISQHIFFDILCMYVHCNNILYMCIAACNTKYRLEHIRPKSSWNASDSIRNH